jgi:hypothetical protein
VSGWTIVFIGYAVAAAVWLVFMFLGRKGVPEDR